MDDLKKITRVEVVAAVQIQSHFRRFRVHARGLSSPTSVRRYMEGRCDAPARKRQRRQADTFSDVTDRMDIIRRDFKDERYVSECGVFQAVPGQTLLIEAGCACGKSDSIRKWLVLHPELSVVAFSVRRAHADNLNAELVHTGLGFKSYLDPTCDSQNERHLTMSLESVWTIKDRSFDVVILDEARTLMDNLNGETMREQMPVCVQALERMCRDSRYLIAADADVSLDGGTYALLKGCAPRRRITHSH